MSSAEYDNQFFNDSSDIFLVGILKDPLETETQSMVDVPVHKENLIIQRTPLVDAIISMFPEKTTPSPTPIPPTTEAQVTIVSESDSSLTVRQRISELEKKVEALSKVDHTKAIKESVQANVINEIKNQLPKYLPKAISDSVKPRMESTNRLFGMIKKSGFILEHEKNLELYNALIGSIGLDETITKGKLDPTRVLKKRCHDDKDQDPPTDSEKEKKRRRMKDTELSNKQTISIDSSKCAEMDVEELVEDDVVNVEKQPQDDVAPKRDNSIWFMQDVVVKPETPDPKWHKEPNVDDTPKQNWFNELVNAKKDPLTFDDLIGSIIDFIKFSKNHLKKDKITKVDLEGLAFKLLKRTCRNNIELEYNLEHCYLTLSDQLDLANPKGNRCPYALSKPLPLPHNLVIDEYEALGLTLSILRSSNWSRVVVRPLIIGVYEDLGLTLVPFIGGKLV
ncbi:hypothetical protein Tco_1109964 [Tanacetum coccineum]|uniref:Uncharacterized protein n=1 Tax=Tanacetum coccineum TaxID=301880 RepID=A0ABQ5IHW6_9ASTR